ncbi:MAG: PPOX class F420-dependent oxidoreductase [Actinomycetota bacterium]|nr:PPOX class F420-dependent oxidoreductase [Actinomycetota bacterium]
MEVQEARRFLEANHRAVLATRQVGGGTQLTPVLATVDDQGRAIISTRETAYKTANLRRDPRASLCVMNDRFFGEWMQIDGTAEIVSLPEAMEPLVDYYRRVAGEHDDWDDYREAMSRQQRVLLRITVDHAGPDRRG